MHPLLTSRQQDLDATPTHRALLSNLGILAKSQSHAAALAASLKTNRNDDHSAPLDLKGFVKKASPDLLLSARQRAADEAHDKAAELAYEKRRKALLASRSNNADDDLGVNPKDEEDDDMEEGSGSSLSKSLTPGAFSKLRLGLLQFIKDQYSDHTQSFEERYGAPAHVVGLTPVVKPTPISKSIQAASERVAKTLGVSPMKSLNQKMAAIAGKLGNQQLAKSISGGNVGGLRSAMPRYTVPQVEAAASAALAHGAIDAQSAQVIANSLALGGVGAVPRELMAALRGE